LTFTKCQDFCIGNKTILTYWTNLKLGLLINNTGILTHEIFIQCIHHEVQQIKQPPTK